MPTSEYRTGHRTVRWMGESPLIIFNNERWRPPQGTSMHRTGARVWVGERTDGGLAVRVSAVARDTEVWYPESEMRN